MSELQKMLERRKKIADGEEAACPVMASVNPATLFPEFSRKQMNEYKKRFDAANESKTGFISEMELKRMMEKLGHPLTHVALHALMAEIDTDRDNQISFTEFLMIFRKAAHGELAQIEGLSQLVASVDVSEVGVSGAKNFFEAKANALKHAKDNEEEIKREQEEKRKEREEAAARKKAFKEKAAMFGK